MRRKLKTLAIELESQGISVFRRLAYLAARDITDEIAGGPILVVAPHPDDETLGCGATILRARDRGQRVQVVIVTDGQASHHSAWFTRDQLVALRQAEAIAACERLGVAAHDVIFLGYPDGEAQRHLEEGRRAIKAVADALAPGLILYSSALDSHPDHRAVAAMVEPLAYDAPAGRRVLGYPVWFWRLRTWFKLGQMLRGLGQVSIVRVSTGDLIERKRLALAAHRSQFENLTGEPGWEVLRPSFARHFLGPNEVFFEPKAGRSPPAPNSAATGS
ncbi:MAG: PIG-L family deacetylase [Caulobacteraceae bacterium]|nr:PIG-L family deacetylase [Caulobacteraceae bacterium]